MSPVSTAAAAAAAPEPAAVASISTSAPIPSARSRTAIKISELPLSAQKRATIDGLVHTFKKKGGFDHIRKEVFKAVDSPVGYLYCAIVLGSAPHDMKGKEKTNLRSSLFTHPL